MGVGTQASHRASVCVYLYVYVLVCVCIHVCSSVCVVSEGSLQSKTTTRLRQPLLTQQLLCQGLFQSLFF